MNDCALLVETAKHLVAVAESHELSSCSCDRDGRFCCECFEDALASLKKAIAATESHAKDTITEGN